MFKHNSKHTIDVIIIAW